MQNRIINNTKWIIGCKVAQSLIQFLVGVLTARYLGPSDYGLINYAASVVAFFVPLMELGLRHTLVQEYVSKPEKEGEIVGTSLVMNMAASLLGIAGVVLTAAIINHDDKTAILVCCLYSISMFFQAVDMLQYWFQAKLLSKYSSVAMLCAYVVVSTYKIILLATHKSVFWFALSQSVEFAAIGILLLAVYYKIGAPRLMFSVSMMRTLIAKSKFYIVSALMVVVFGRIGNLLLSWLCGETENGYYAAALTCTGITSFVFLAIIDSVRPVVLDSKKQSQHAFDKNISRTYSAIVWLSLAQSVFITIFAKLIIRILYGAEFLPAVPVLQILVWNTAFSYMGYVRNIWILGEEQHQVLWIINLGGAIASIASNAVLIPLWGACGAAAASVFTQVFTNWIMGYILKPVRRNNQLLLKGMNPKLLLEMIPELLRSRKEDT